MRKLGKKTVFETIYVDDVFHGRYETTKNVYEKKDGSLWAYFVCRYERVRPISFRLGFFELRIDYRTMKENSNVIYMENKHASQTQKQTV